VNIKINYIADLRLRQVEVRTGTTVFLVDVEHFHRITEADIESIEGRRGTLVLSSNLYISLRKEATHVGRLRGTEA
jgi:hypothetical protein